MFTHHDINVSSVIYNKRRFWHYLLCWELLKVLLQKSDVQQ